MFSPTSPAPLELKINCILSAQMTVNLKKKNNARSNRRVHVMKLNAFLLCDVLLPCKIMALPLQAPQKCKSGKQKESHCLSRPMALKLSRLKALLVRLKTPLRK